MNNTHSQQINNPHLTERIIIGTAGHIDHGKTSLVKALTGIDTDRLPEEKQRGMTIDLGFAHLNLGTDRRISIVDVPGHERFVKNMLAGATSINLVLFVIAADDGIMPQTTEHLEIINLLGIKHGLVALTKKDLVTEEWLGMVREEVRKILVGTSLEHAPIIPVSTVTGEGIETCKTTIKDIIARIKTQDVSRVFRLPVDRSFTISGYGCVVTGPVLGGHVSVDDELEILPIKKILRVRGIEVTGERVNTAFAGQRAAINLAGIKSPEIKRGYELSVPGYLQPAHIADASLRLIKHLKSPLKNRTRIRLHINTSEVIGRIILLDREQLSPGEASLVQIILENPVTIEREDRFIIRSYSPAYTIGGGKMLRYNTTRSKRFKEETLKALKTLAGGNLSEIVEQVYLNNCAKNSGWPFTFTADAVSRQANIHPSIAVHVIAELLKKGILMKFDIDGKDVIFHRDIILSVKEHILNTLKTFHKQHPLKTGIEETHLKTLIAASPAAVSINKDVHPLLFTASLLLLKHEKAIKITDDKLSLADFTVEVSTKDRNLSDKLEEVFLKAGFTPPSIEEILAKHGNPARSFILLLVEQKRLIRIEDGLYFHTTVLNKLKEIIMAHVNKHGHISVAQFRDLTKTSRKFAVPLLEYFDAIHFTKRTGDVRILL